MSGPSSPNSSGSSVRRGESFVLPHYIGISLSENAGPDRCDRLPYP